MKPRLKRVLVTYSIILGVAVIGLLVRMVKNEIFGMRLQIILFFTSFILISITWEFLRLVHRRLNHHFPFEKSIPTRIALQLILGIIFIVFVRLLIYKFGEPYLPFKPDSLFLAATWALYILISIALNMIFFATIFLERWKESIRMTERLEREKTQVQFDNLKNQLNPHFLFNALTSLNSLIHENQQLASQFLQHMSKVYRYVLQNKEKNFVTLRTELDFIQNYVFLLETRFKDALKINFDIAEPLEDRAVVPVTLQILIENAIKHNIVDIEKKLTIDIITVGDYLVVSNNLQIRNRVETSNKQGLQNLKSFYKFLSDRPVIVEPTTDRFYVKVPLI